MKRVLSLVAIAVLPTAALAQQPTVTQQSAAAEAPAVAMRANWRSQIENVTQAAKDMSEADYAYRPVATVRTFGELIAHIAGAQRMFCAAALGEAVPAEDAVEKTAKTKADLVKALEESTEYCNRAYAAPTASLGATGQLFGQTMTRAHILTMNAVHDGEHYGNIVTYMRMKGMVPPSSRRQ